MTKEEEGEMTPALGKVQKFSGILVPSSRNWAPQRLRGAEENESERIVNNIFRELGGHFCPLLFQPFST